MQFDSELALAYEAGRQAWPDLDLDHERFAERARAGRVAPEDLRARAADLFLAYACADGDRTALRQFEAAILSRVEIYVARLGMTAPALDETRQRVRVKLLTGDPPAIARYRGRGPLAAWVRVTTVRLALDLAASDEGGAPKSADRELLELTAPLDDNPEMEAARALYRQRFQAGLEAALAGLSTRDKTLLRLHVVEALNVDAIGRIYRVHRATAARWLLAIRSRIFQSVRNELGLRRLVSPSELGSLATLLRDEIHISAERILRAES
jgi:RNA polymerase sigma-70 factor, ECF subfamily